MVLIVLEAIVAKVKGMKINRSADVISSLSSGITNTIRDSSNGMIISIITIMFGTDESYVYTACIYTL